MKDITLNIEKAFGFVSADAVKQYAPQAAACLKMLHEGTGKGNDFLGWLRLPSDIEAELDAIEAAAKTLRDKCEVVVVVGIGGSYLGAKAVNEALADSFEWLKKEHKAPIIVYAGQNIGEDYLYELQSMLKTKRSASSPSRNRARRPSRRWHSAC